MDPVAPIGAELFPHLRIVMGMVVGLGITRLLTGVAGLIQHPSRAKISAIHLLWVAAILLEFIHFWWWEFGLFQVTSWSFEIFSFLILYAIVIYLQAALLFPDDVDEYEGYEDFFLKRRKWFFGLFALKFVADVIDTLIKGEAHWQRFGIEYFIQVPVGLALCLLAVLTDDRRIHLALVLLYTAYQISWIVRFFDIIS